MIPEEILRELYLTQNLSKLDVAKRLGYKSACPVDKALRFYNIYKSKEQIEEGRWKKQRATCKQLYGIENISSLESIKLKRKETCQRKYGKENVFQTEEVKSKIKEHWKTLGVSNVSQLEDTKKKVRETCQRKYGTKNYLQSIEYQERLPEIQEKVRSTNINKHGVEWFCLRPECFMEAGHNVSKANLKWQKILEAHDFKVVLEKKVQSRLFDIWLKDTNILLEINPSYTHNSTKNFFSENSKPKDKYYHQLKSKVAYENGYYCIHIWDWLETDDVLDYIQYLLDTQPVLTFGEPDKYHVCINTKNQIFVDIYDEGCYILE